MNTRHAFLKPKNVHFRMQPMHLITIIFKCWYFCRSCEFYVTKFRELRTNTKPVFFFLCNNGFFKIVRTNLFFFLFMYFYFTSYQSSKKWDRVIEMKCSFNCTEILLWLHVPEILDIKIWFLLLSKIMLAPYSIQNI